VLTVAVQARVLRRLEGLSTTGQAVLGEVVGQRFAGVGQGLSQINLADSFTNLSLIRDAKQVPSLSSTASCSSVFHSTPQCCSSLHNVPRAPGPLKHSVSSPSLCPIFHCVCVPNTKAAGKQGMRMLGQGENTNCLNRLCCTSLSFNGFQAGSSTLQTLGDLWRRLNGLPEACELRAARCRAAPGPSLLWEEEEKE